MLEDKYMIAKPQIIIKNFSMVFLIICIIFTVNPSEVAAQDITVNINGQELQMEAAPVIIRDRVMIPFRDIFEAMDAKFEWDSIMKTITGTKGDITYTIQINNKVAMINDKPVTMDVAPMIIKERTMVPLRFVAESFGEKVVWDGQKRLVIIGEHPIIGNPKVSSISGTILKDNFNLEYIPGQTCLFKKGTVINLYPNGFVKDGTLAENTKFIFKNHANRRLNLAGNTMVQFNSQGFIKSGVLEYNCRLEYIDVDKIGLSTIPFSARNTLVFKAKMPIIFFDDGYVKSGTLNEDSLVQYEEDKTVELKGDTDITFYQTGMLKSGVLKEDINLSYSPDKSTSFKHNNFISFTPMGYVSEGTLLTNAALFFNQKGISVKCKENTPVSFYESGFIRNATLKEKTLLPFRKSGDIFEAIFDKDTVITVKPNGLVESGTLANDYYLPYFNSYKTFKAGESVQFDSQGCVVGK